MSTAASRQYDLWSHVYDRLWRGYTERTLSELLVRAYIEPEDRVLDVGCGTGSFAEQLVRANQRQHIVGVDASEKMLARARRKLEDFPNVSFVQAASHELPFEAGEFNVVVTSSTLHYFRRPVETLADIKRVLAPGGRLYLLDWCRDHTSTRIRDAVLRIIDPAHVRCYSGAEVERMILEAGLEMPRLETFHAGSYALFMAEAERPADHMHPDIAHRS